MDRETKFDSSTYRNVTSSVCEVPSHTGTAGWIISVLSSFSLCFFSFFFSPSPYDKDPPPPPHTHTHTSSLFSLSLFSYLSSVSVPFSFPLSLFPLSFPLSLVSFFTLISLLTLFSLISLSFPFFFFYFSLFTLISSFSPTSRCECMIYPEVTPCSWWEIKIHH